MWGRGGEGGHTGNCRGGAAACGQEVGRAWGQNPPLLHIYVSTFFSAPENECGQGKRKWDGWCSSQIYDPGALRTPQPTPLPLFDPPPSSPSSQACAGDLSGVMKKVEGEQQQRSKCRKFEIKTVLRVILIFLGFSGNETNSHYMRLKTSSLKFLSVQTEQIPENSILSFSFFSHLFDAFNMWRRETLV